MLDSLVIGSRDWLPLALALLILGWGSALWSWWRSPVRSWAVSLATLCKLVAVTSVALYLVEPLVRSKRPKPGANSLAVIVDNSRSMSIRAPGQSNSLEDKLKSVLQSDAAWHTRAAQDFAVRLYSFDQRLHAIESFDQIQFDGKSSELGTAIETVRSRFADRPVAGILLFTDGMATDTLPQLGEGDGNSLPIYPIVDIGHDHPRDVALTDPTVNQSAFELAPVQVEATLRCQGLKGQSINVRLIDEGGKTLQQQSVTAESDLFTKRVRFQFRPEEPGIQFVSVRAMLKSEDNDEAGALPSRTEATTANNSRLLAVDRGGGPYRILYLAGRTSWDFKFLKRAVEEDEELRLAALIRIARKEAKFSFRDRAVDSTNPLFAGFEEDQDAAEQYDEPILLRMGVREAEELKGGFPKTEEELFQFDAIILDDIEAKFFTQEQMLLIRQFVATRGGGFLMMGGVESFERGGYRDTPIGDLLPVYLRPTQDAGQLTTDALDSHHAEVAYRLTREGSLEPWVRLRSSETEEAKRIAEMPRFSSWNRVRDVKPGASVLAMVSRDGERSWPAMVTQNFGSGRTASLMIADMWRWSMRRTHDQTDDLAQCWRQVARWLTADGLRRLSVEIQPPSSSNEPHTISIQTRDANYHALDNADVEVTLLPPDGKLVMVDVVPDREQSGLLHAKVWSLTDGPYVVSVKAKAPDGEMIGEVESGWTAEPSAQEFQNLAADLEPLASLAEQSGGEVIDIDDLDRLVASLPTRQVPITETRVEPLWHRTSWLMLTIACLCIEWGLRRWKGLP